MATPQPPQFCPQPRRPLLAERVLSHNFLIEFLAVLAVLAVALIFTLLLLVLLVPVLFKVFALMFLHS